MSEDLVFPRTIYRGAPDTLGLGTHSHPDTGVLVGETKRCEDAAQLAVDQKDGWRLTRELPKSKAEQAADAKDDVDAARNAAKAKK